MRILIVEDEPKVAAFIGQGLKESGHEVEVAADGNTGERAALRSGIDLVVLDVMLPGKGGVEVCRAIRREKPKLPILMLTALGTTDDKIVGLDAGADDYLVKPFEFKELLARIRSLTRRTNGGPVAGERLVYADLELDVDRKEAVRQGKRIVLTPKEFALLEYLMRNPERVLSRAQISDEVWDIHFDTGTNVIDVYIKLLRKKVDRDMGLRLIHTRVGLGYILTDRP